MPSQKPFHILFLRSGGHFADLEYPDGPMIAPPKAILYLAGMFRQNPDVKVDFIDLLAYPDFGQLDTRHPPFYFGMPVETCLDHIERMQPDLVALTSTAHYFFEDEVRLLRRIRSRFPALFQVVGGPDPTNDYESYFNAVPELEAIIREEGELSFLALVDALRQGKDWHSVPGLCYRKGAVIQVNPAPPKIKNLEDYPPDYSIVDLEHYFYLNQLGYPSRAQFRYPGSHRAIDILTSRGCSYDCSFCCISLHMGQGWRPVGIAAVLEEIRVLVEVYGVRHLRFEDDHLLGNPARFKDLLRAIHERGYQLTWDTPNGIRADAVDAEFLQLCRLTGCTYLNLGVESGSQAILDQVLEKKLELSRVEEAARLCYEAGIDAFAMFVVGLPGENTQDMLATYDLGIRLFRQYHLKPVLQLWRPYRNTRLDRKAAAQDQIENPDVYELYRLTGIPYTLFYNRLYRDELNKLGFLSRTYREYLREARNWLIRNWLRIVGRRPLRLVLSLLAFSWTMLKIILCPRRRKYYIQHEILDYLFYPFAYLNKVRAQ